RPVPDPRGPVPEDDHRGGLLEAAAHGLGVEAGTKLLDRLDGADIRGRVRIAHGPALLIKVRLREYTPQFGLACSGPSVWPLARPPLGVFRDGGNAGAVHGDVQSGGRSNR